MTHVQAWMPAATGLVEQLVRASIHAVWFIAAVWIVCKLAPRIPAWVRSSLWWLACVEPIVRLLWAQPIELPLRQAPFLAAWPQVSWVTATQDMTIPQRLPAAGAGSSSILGVAALVVAFFWGAACLVQAGRLVRALRRSRRLLLYAAEPIEPGLARRFEDLRQALGIRVAVRLRVSRDVESAQVTGLLRPVVVLPARDLESLSETELDLALGHELLHVRRGDLWLGWLPAIAERLFFFHPLVRHAVREYALAREAACDAEVLDELRPSPQVYGRLLVDLGIVRRDIGAAAVGMAASPKALARRLEMLAHASDAAPARRRIWWLLLAAAAVAAVPLQGVAVGPKSGKSHAAPDDNAMHIWSWSEDDARGSIAIVTDDVTNMMHGSSDDANQAKSLWRKGKGDMLYFRNESGIWVVRDAKVVAEAQRIIEPQQKLGEQQAELGARQAELGARQAELGEQQAALGSRQARLAEEQAKLTQRQFQGELAPAERDALEERMRDLGRRQGELGAEQGALGARQGELGAKQSVLGQHQGVLGQQQAELAQAAEPKLWELLTRAQEAGVAEKVE